MAGPRSAPANREVHRSAPERKHVISQDLGVAIIAALITGAVVVIAGSILLRTVPYGKALLIYKRRRIDVSFTGAVVLPVVHRAELMNVSVRHFTLLRRGVSHLVSADGVATDLTMTFFVRVNRTAPDVVRVAQTLGAEEAESIDAIQDFFAAKFTEAMRTAVRRRPYLELHGHPEEVRDDVIDTIGRDLAGFRLEDATIDRLIQTPASHLG